MAVRMDRESFLRNLRRSGLVTDQQLAEALPNLPHGNRGRPIARAFVKMGLLTKFQAELILAGRTSGFFLAQYVILEQLGQGGMGRVFKAMHQTMNRLVALKLLAPHLVQTPRAMKLFQREVQAAARLNHPNIVTAYDANQIGDRHYLVMEFVAGPNLDQLVRRKGPLPTGVACEIIRQAAMGLQYAHEMGMVHRDIKPANFLVQKPTRNTNLTVKILDFGLARLQEFEQDGESSESKERTTVMGTPDFLSPEQGRGIHDVDIRSDLYSLGCTLYYLLVGRVPFPGGTSLEKLQRHQTEEPVLVENYRPDVTETVADIVRKLMAKEPARRFQAPAEVAAAVSPFAENDLTFWLSREKTPGTDEHPILPSTGDFSLEKPSEADKGTLPSNFGPTPTSHLDYSSLEVIIREERRRRKKILVLSLAGSLVALITLIFLFRLLF
jgi:serine/threonine protein kinase